MRIDPLAVSLSRCFITFAIRSSEISIEYDAAISKVINILKKVVFKVQDILQVRPSRFGGPFNVDEKYRLGDIVDNGLEEM